jgi:hypothetical protein
VIVPLIVGSSNVVKICRQGPLPYISSLCSCRLCHRRMASTTTAGRTATRRDGRRWIRSLVALSQLERHSMDVIVSRNRSQQWHSTSQAHLYCCLRTYVIGRTTDVPCDDKGAAASPRQPAEQIQIDRSIPLAGKSSPEYQHFRRVGFRRSLSACD